ncbi:hypothetical protein AURDEDRAFT_183827 [Auricularia subglabra TFB-10046 SS5]|nr:hypothetical protein AURDEDRAFT_183827 [Auricularia subglabra TFB-10046 SS5]
MANFPQPERLVIVCGFRSHLQQSSWDGLDDDARNFIFGPRLRTLSLYLGMGDCPYDICKALAIHRVPELTVSFEQDVDVELGHFIGHLPPQLALSVHDAKGDVMIRLAGLASQPDTADPGWRSFAIDRGFYLPGMLVQLEHAFSRVVEMDLSHEFLLDFRYEVTVQSLPQLACLRINTGDFQCPVFYGHFWPSGFSDGATDFTYLSVDRESSPWNGTTSWGPPRDTLDQPDAEIVVDCPNLKRLELYSTTWRRSTVDRREIVHLARDFSLLPVRSKPSAVQLFLKNVVLVGSPHVAMGMIFSGIHEEPQCTADGPSVASPNDGQTL